GPARSRTGRRQRRASRRRASRRPRQVRATAVDHRMRWTTPLVLLLLGLVAALLATREPGPAPADAAPQVFSAGRALADVRAIAQRPHPIGSAESLRVQAYLLKRMADLGLAPQTHPFASPKGEGRNLLGVLPGHDRQAPAVLLMAHHDSVPSGPGAADDGAGVSAVLETVRALQTVSRQRDVMVLLTDGEEAGLLGAKAFFGSDPARLHVGLAINLEARGNRGRAVMFETHRNAAPLIRALVDSDSLAAASSLMPDLYRRLPNDTDLTEAIRHGYAGLNFAFFAGLDAYHRPSDTPGARSWQPAAHRRAGPARRPHPRDRTRPARPRAGPGLRRHPRRTGPAVPGGGGLGAGGAGRSGPRRPRLAPGQPRPAQPGRRRGGGRRLPRPAPAPRPRLLRPRRGARRGGGDASGSPASQRRRRAGRRGAAGDR